MTITVKAHKLKAQYPKPAQMFSENSEKFAKLQGESPWRSTFLIKLQICRYAVTLLELDYITYDYL